MHEALSNARGGAQTTRPPPVRPMSARPSSAVTNSFSLYSAAAAAKRYDEYEEDEGDGEGEEDLVDNDDEDCSDEDAFGAAGDRFHAVKTRQQQQQLSQTQQANRADSNNRAFRPSSAPPVRAKMPFSGASDAVKPSQSGPGKKHAAAAMSSAYLRLAAEKKKARDLEFAMGLEREEQEYRKKITLKIDQANKMSLHAGSKRSFVLAPDREGDHMIKVVDPSTSDRFISVELFLREFEKLATVSIGQTHASNSSANQSTSAKSSTSSGSKQQQQNAPRRSKAAASAGAASRLSTSTATRASISRSMSCLFDSSPPKMQAGAKRLATVKATNQSQVQEELKGVLADTIALSKVLQDQLHELKLKGWNFTTRQ